MHTQKPIKLHTDAKDCCQARVIQTPKDDKTSVGMSVCVVGQHVGLLSVTEKSPACNEYVTRCILASTQSGVGK